MLKLSEALFAQDIELLRNNEKLGKVEKLKNDFIEKMSRELRTPLNSIIEAIISVLAGENEHLSDTAKASLRAALDDGTAFLRTLQNILDLWRIKQGELPVESQEVNFREVVEEAIFSVQDTLGDKPVTIERRFHEPLPKMRTDLAKVNQILFLLLDNAVKFTREREGSRSRRRCAAASSPATCATPASGSAPTTGSSCSTSSSRSTTPRRPATAARASASRWCATCSSCSTARSSSRARWAWARASPSACRCIAIGA